MGKVVLVHGAWHGAWCWDGVLAELQERGIDAEAIELPLTSHRDNVEVAAAAIVAAGPDAVVCGHSYGGCVISSAANSGNVARLVYLCALMLDEGEEPFALSRGYEVELSSALVVDETAGTLSVEGRPGRRGVLRRQPGRHRRCRHRPAPPDAVPGRLEPARRPGVGLDAVHLRGVRGGQGHPSRQARCRVTPPTCSSGTRITRRSSHGPAPSPNSWRLCGLTAAASGVRA